MPVSITREELCKVVQGITSSSSQKIVFSGVEFDSRKIRGGELFVALRGEREHGHVHVGEAFNRGAALALVERSDFDTTIDTTIDKDEKDRLVVVPDSLQAFHNLARWWRRELQTPVIAITGSVGKTTIKEMLANILLETGVGVYSQKSFNNHVGVPYTILQLGRQHQWAVIEMGMNHVGEIRVLAKIVEPDVALVTKVASAHIGQFGSIEKIAKAKLEILEGLKEGATIVLNSDDELLLREYELASANRKLKVLRFGERAGSDMKLSDVRSLGLDGISFHLEVDGHSLSTEMGVVGKHNASNAAAAALGARALFPGILSEKITSGLSKFRAPLMRMNLKALPDGRRILDDSYNANPASMRALLELAGELISSGMKVGAILGDMLDLGEHSAEAHDAIGELVVFIRPHFVVCVGDQSKRIVTRALAAGIESMHAASPEEAAELARKLDFDIVVVKASRDIGLDRAVGVLGAER